MKKNKLLSQLKQSILQEAIKGNLTIDWRVEHSNIESASELLNRIKAEKTQLIAENKIKKEKKLPPITQEEVPFELPRGWIWCRLGEITTYGSSQKLDSSQIKDNTWTLDLEDVEKESSKILQYKFFSERPSLSSKSVFKKGWVLYSKLRPYLDKVVVAPKEGVCTTEILPLPIYSNLNSYFLLYSLKGKHFLNYVNSKVGGMKMPRLGTNDGKMALIPLAPVQEQKIIVEKVEALLAQCDKTDVGEDITNYNVENKLVFQLINNYGLIKKVLSELKTQKHLLTQLKQSILQEAIQGKLTAEWRKQNPNTEPASKLLKRIKAEKAQLIKDKKIKKEKPLAPITKEEIPFDLPDGWVWSKLSDICSKTGSGSTPRGGKSAYPDSGISFIRSQNVYDDGIRLRGVAFIADATHEKMKGTKVQAEDLLLNITGGSIGRCCIVPKEFETGNINQHVAIIRTVNTFNGYFIHKVVCSPYFQNMIFEVQTGAGREGLPKNKMDNILIAFPPLEEQKEIVKKVEALMQYCQALAQEITNSEANAQMLMQAVLKEAFEGKTKKEMV